MHQLSRPLRLFAACIALAAGYVDAIGFVGFGGTFVSFMSGNSTRLGAGLVSPGHAPVALTLMVLAAFVGGVAIGQAIGGPRDRARQGRVMWLVAISLGVAAALPLVDAPETALCVAAFAMGATNTIFASSPLPVGLTYMTGTLVKLGQSLGQRLRRETAPPIGPYLVHWSALVLGAALGAGAFVQWGFGALAWAATAFAAMALLGRSVRAE